MHTCACVRTHTLYTLKFEKCWFLLIFLVPFLLGVRMPVRKEGSRTGVALGAASTLHSVTRPRLPPAASPSPPKVDGAVGRRGPGLLSGRASSLHHPLVPWPQASHPASPPRPCLRRCPALTRTRIAPLGVTYSLGHCVSQPQGSFSRG